MEYLKEILAEAILYRVNFKMCHWSARGKHFQKTHDLAEEYANKMLEIEDEIAERYGRESDTFIGYNDVLGVLEESQEEHVVIAGDQSDINYSKLLEYSQKMLGTMMVSISRALESESIKEPHNVGIKAYLEGLFDQLDKETRYLNKHRVMDHE